MLLAPLPYPNPQQVIVPVSTNAARGFDRTSVPYADHIDWREQRDVFAHVAVYQPTAVEVGATDAGGSHTPERVDAASVGEGFFEALGVQPIVGRTFQPADHDGRLLSRLLFQTGSADPLTFAVVLVLLPTIAVVACAVPARRAARADPMTALRSE